MHYGEPGTFVPRNGEGVMECPGPMGCEVGGMEDAQLWALTGFHAATSVVLHQQELT
jgi:hypothetical protein